MGNHIKTCGATWETYVICTCLYISDIPKMTSKQSMTIIFLYLSILLNFPRFYLVFAVFFANSNLFTIYFFIFFEQKQWTKIFLCCLCILYLYVASTNKRTTTKCNLMQKYIWKKLQIVDYQLIEYIHRNPNYNIAHYCSIFRQFLDFLHLFSINGIHL